MTHSRLVPLARVLLLIVSLACGDALGAGRPEGSRGAAARPLIAVIGDNDGTEVTDFVIPFGVLTASGVAVVVDVSLRPGPLRLMPGLTIEATETVASFDAKHDRGADFVIVPAVHGAENPDLIAWVRRQAELGATIVGICDGVWVVARAGLLDDRTATGHWYSMDGLASEFPETRWVRDRRYVRDDGVMTTTGVTASIPASLALVEQIAGRARAAEVARELGVPGWGTEHESDLFRLSWRHLATAARNWLSFWRHETLGIPVHDGIDEIALSLTADALGRTYRTDAVTIGAGAAPVVTRRGLRILPDLSPGEAGVDRVEQVPSHVPAARALDHALATIAATYGAGTAGFVALQVEYDWRGPRLPAAANPSP